MLRLVVFWEDEDEDVVVEVLDVPVMVIWKAGDEISCNVDSYIFKDGMKKNTQFERRFESGISTSVIQL